MVGLEKTVSFFSEHSLLRLLQPSNVIFRKKLLLSISFLIKGKCGPRVTNTSVSFPSRDLGIFLCLHGSVCDMVSCMLWGLLPLMWGCLPEWSLRPWGQASGPTALRAQSRLAELTGPLSGFLQCFLPPSLCPTVMGETLLSAFHSSGRPGTLLSTKGQGQCGPHRKEARALVAGLCPTKVLRVALIFLEKKNVPIALYERVKNNPDQTSFFGSFGAGTVLDDKTSFCGGIPSPLVARSLRPFQYRQVSKRTKAANTFLLS